ncbi:MAG: substrate-binding domain-containing protein [Spirochaetota bacterium]
MARIPAAAARSIAVINKQFFLKNLAANRLFSDFIRGVSDGAGDAGFLPIFLDKGTSIPRFIASGQYKRYIGVIAACPWELKEEIPHFRRLLKRIPFVSVLSNTLPGVCALPDNSAGMEKLTEHLIAEGHRDIGYISLKYEPYALERFRAFAAVMESHSLPVRQECVVGFNVKRRVFRAAQSRLRKVTAFSKSLPAHMAAAFDAVLTIPVHPSAVICESDHIAYHLIQYASARGLSVPEDIAVTGFDNIPCTIDTDRAEAQRLTKLLTTIDQNAYRIGSESVSLLAAVIEGRAKNGTRIAIEPTMVIRRSSLKRSLSDSVQEKEMFRRTAHSYIERYFAAPLQLKRIASEFGIDHGTFLRKFRKYCGDNFVHAVTKRRLAQASLLLRTTAKPVKSIASISGFASYENFIRLFTKDIGITPLAYRKRSRKTAAKSENKGSSLDSLRHSSVRVAREP